MSRTVLSDDRLARMRLASGLVLFFYVTLHLINHAAGLISLDAMIALNEPIRAFWRFPPATIILYGALAVHFGSALTRLVRRRTLKMPISEVIQIVLGLSIPFLLLVHVMGTRYMSERYGVNDGYIYVLISTFHFSPVSGVLNALGLIAAWGHGCIGLFQWLRLKRVYTRTMHEWAIAVSVALPSAALTSFLFHGRAIAARATDGEFMAEYYSRLGVENDEVYAWINRDIDVARWGLIAILVTALFARFYLKWRARREGVTQIRYLDGPTVRHTIGPTLLEISKLSGVPHASVCGGKGRCSTCRVRVIKSQMEIDEPSESERKVLNRFHADQDVRLACQIRPKGWLEVQRLLPSDATMQTAGRSRPWDNGQEKTITVMFADLRDFTRTAESRLPFDIVYLINQFSRSMGQIVEAHDGHIDKFLGDGFMALFGLESDGKTSARQALAAARDMISELKALNERLKGDLDQPLRMGIGLHTGSVVLGEMGYGSARGLTAIGDTVNTASRLEAATKDHACAVCVSANTMKLAGEDRHEAERKRIRIRGKSGLIEVFALDEDRMARHESQIEPA